MKTNKDKRLLPYEPCGLEIAPEDVFKSSRNLGLSLMATLTGAPTEDIEINRCAMSIGLGCFSSIGIGHSEYNDIKDIAVLNEMEEWSLISSIGYRIYDDIYYPKKKIEGFSMLNLNIEPSDLLNPEISDFGIQLFGPKRLLSKIKSSGQRIKCFDPTDLDICNYLTIYPGDPNDTILIPSSEEMDLFASEKNPRKKLRILLNIITSFASEISMRLMSVGWVYPHHIYLPNNAFLDSSEWFKDGKLETRWTPTKKQVFETVQCDNLELKDICYKSRKLLPWLNAKFIAKARTSKKKKKYLEPQ